ncbi:Proline--tRNA ligase 2 [Frankliniella fusca]|uniref:Proline--tRNA ligase 2 n=1 Tax=Frankliniella fusca TaxID=407009 RepID=A0AAE1HBQ0_9NEOP|nr:Proline--tRNA ligase 2 [Frankliniella fusca]
MTSTQSTVVNFSILDMQHRIRRVDYLNEAKCKLGNDFDFPTSRREASAKQSDSCAQALPNLPEDIDIEFLISSAKEEAVKLATNLGMLTNKRSTVPFMEIPKCALNNGLDEEDLNDEHDLEHIEMDPNCCENEDENGEEDDDDDEDISDISGGCNEYDVAEDLLQISSDTLKVKSLSNRDVNPSSPFVKVLDGNGVVIIWKSTLCWILSSSDFKLSSDRLIRVKSPAVQSHTCSAINQNMSLTPSVDDEICVGNYCAFWEKGSVVIGRVLEFSYSAGRTRHEQQYSKLTAPTTPPASNARGIDCLCMWYKIGKNKRLQSIPMDVHGYYSISHYMCTEPRPTIINNHLVLSCSERQILNVTKNK